jgi:hypothetical protein
VSLSADEALKARVVDVVATNLADLLKEIHGNKVKLATGEIIQESWSPCPRVLVLSTTERSRESGLEVFGP